MFSRNQKYLLASLGATFLIWLVPFLLGKDVSIFTNDLFYIVLTVLLVVVSVYRVIKTTGKKLRIAWTLFLVSSLAMLFAQHLWTLDELVLGVKPFPSNADIAFMIGYILWIPFFAILVRQEKRHISKMMIAVAVGVSCSIIMPNIMLLLQSSGGAYSLSDMLLSAYPVIDGVAFFPASVGIMLFLKGRANFYPSLIFLAMVPQLIGDLLFEVTSHSGGYYSGSPADLFYTISFVLFMYGAYDLNPLTKSDEKGVINA